MPAHADPVPDIDPDLAPATLHHTWILMPLLAPFGIGVGYTTVTLGFQLSKAGVSTTLISAIIAAGIAAQTWKMLWAPLVDTLATPRLWYALGICILVASMLALSVLPHDGTMVVAFTALSVISSVASSLTSMAVELVMTQGVHPAQRGAAGGWSQAGNVGGTGIGGGLGLVIAQHFAATWAPGAVLAVICLGCWSFMAMLPPLPPRDTRLRYGRRLVAVGRDVVTVARSRRGWLALVLMILPIASGEAPFQLIGGEWRANGDLVALVSGTLTGVISAVGALIGGYLCDRVDPRAAYCLSGVLSGVIAAIMALAPHTPYTFTAFVLLYGLFIGSGFAAYSAIVLQAIGHRSAATNFNLMSALSNVPLAIMTGFDGWMVDAHGTGAMLFGELWLQVIAIAGFGLLAVVTRRPYDGSLRRGIR